MMSNERRSLKAPRSCPEKRRRPALCQKAKTDYVDHHCLAENRAQAQSKNPEHLPLSEEKYKLASVAIDRYCWDPFVHGFKSRSMKNQNCNRSAARWNFHTDALRLAIGVELKLTNASAGEGAVMPFHDKVLP